MAAIDLTIDDIYKGKATMIKDRQYFTTKQYIEPFIDKVDKMCQGKFIVKALPADQISLTPEGEINLEDTIYNRVWIQGILPGEYGYNNHQQSINMLYALDTRKPLVKIFKNTLNMACLNMCVFNPEHMEIQDLEPATPINYGAVERILEKVDDTRRILETLSAITYERDELMENLGNWIDRCINIRFASQYGTVKLSEDLPIEVYKNLFYNKTSRYYSETGITDGFNVYNAFTDIITNDKGKDICNKFEKIYLVSQLLGLK